MSDKITFYTNPISRGRIVRWMLEEVGEPYETKVLDYPSMKGTEYLAINPMGKVPAITHGDTVITECAAICAYLADAFPQAQLAPPHGSKLRAPYYRWMFYAAGPIEAAMTNTALKVVVPPERKGMAGYGSLDDVLNTLDKTLADTEYLAGDHFTAADLYFGAALGWGMMFGIIEKRPAYLTYFDRLKDRPAAVRARDIDDALIPPEMRQKAS